VIGGKQRNFQSGESMELQGELKEAFERSVTLSWAMVAALVLYPIAVEIMRMRDVSFEGFAPQTAGRIRDFVYGFAIVLPLCIRSIRKAILKRNKLSDLHILARKMLTATVITILAAEIPALLGLLMFLLGGVYREFYIALAYSLLVILIYFPRRSQWEMLLLKGVIY
jgi:hypothetical protein